MKKGWKMFFAAILIFTALGIKKLPPEPPRVVTRIHISCDRGYCIARRTYIDCKKIEPVLNLLRQRKNLGPAQTDPERLTGDAYRLEVFLSDGTKYVYYQRAGQYYSEKCHAWQKTDPKQAQRLVELLRRTPSDPEITFACARE